MLTVVLHIGNPADDTGRPTICLEDFDPETGNLTKVDGTGGEVPEELLTECDTLLRELKQSGGEVTARAHIGVELYGYMAQTSAGREWLRRCKASGVRNKDGRWDQPTLRTYLHIEPESLQRLPWELMAESDEANSFGPFRSANHLAVRGQPPAPAEPESMLGNALPLSILVAIYDIKLKLTEEEHFRAAPQAEVDAIFAALRKQPGMWHVEVLRQPREQDLRESLVALRPQILHFIGEPAGQIDPEFVARQLDGEVESFKVSALERILSDIDDPPRLFVLNGCRTADMASPERFRDLGSKAVIANQAIVYGPPAITFTETFYQNLATTCDVSQAVWQARRALWRIQRKDQYDWGIPVLTLYDGPDTIIQGQLPNIALNAEIIIQVGDFDRAALHFDRLHQSRQVWSCVDSRKQIALISGRRYTGTSLLMRTCMLTWKLRGHPAILFDAWKATEDYDGRATIRTVLLHVCEELKVEFGSAPPIIARLDKLLDEVRSASFAGNADTDDVHPYVKPCRDLISILKEATTADRPLMLAFDSLRDFYQEDLQKRLKKHIFRPIARGMAGATYLVIATEEEALLDWREAEWDGWVQRVRLRKFSHSDAIPMAHEYGARRGWHGQVHETDGNKQMADWIEKVRKSPDFQGSWFPAELCDLADDFHEQWVKER